MRRIGASGLITAVLLAMAAAPPADAERLVTSVSTHRVLITSNFTGQELVLFGAIDGVPVDAQIGAYDVVVSVRGPARSFVTRQKDRMLGLWVNTDSRDFIQVPSYLAVMTNKPVAEIGPPETLRRYRIGLVYNVLPSQAASDITEVLGAAGVEAVRLRERETGSEEEIPCRGLFVFVGLAPLGSLQMGALAERIGPSAAVALGGAATALAVAVAAWRVPELRRTA